MTESQNRTSLSINLKDENIVGHTDFIQFIEKKLATFFIEKISIDDTVLDYIDFKQTDFYLDQDSRVKVVYCSHRQLLSETLVNLKAYTDYIIGSIIKRDKTEDDQSNFIFSLAGHLNQFAEGMAAVANFYKHETKLSLDIAHFSKLEIHFLTSIKLLWNAQQNNDRIMMNDTLDSDIIENIKAWKIFITRMLYEQEIHPEHSRKKASVKSNEDDKKTIDSY